MIKIVLATVVGTIAYLIFGWFVFEFCLGDYMYSHTTQLVGFKKDEATSSMLMLIVSCKAYALLLSIMMGYWAKVDSVRQGFIMGAVVGILVAIMTDSYWYATSTFYNDITPVIVDVLAAGVSVGFMGGVIAWVLSMFE